MTAALEVRLATPADADAIAAIYNEGIEGSWRSCWTMKPGDVVLAVAVAGPWPAPR